MFTQSRGVVQWTGSADIVFGEVVEFGLKVWVLASLAVCLFDVEDQRHQRFGNKSTAVHAEMSGIVGARAIRFNCRFGWGIQSQIPVTIK